MESSKVSLDVTLVWRLIGQLEEPTTFNNLAAVDQDSSCLPGQELMSYEHSPHKEKSLPDLHTSWSEETREEGADEVFTWDHSGDKCPSSF